MNSVFAIKSNCLQNFAKSCICILILQKHIRTPLYQFSSSWKLQKFPNNRNIWQFNRHWVWLNGTSQNWGEQFWHHFLCSSKSIAMTHSLNITSIDRICVVHVAKMIAQQLGCDTRYPTRKVSYGESPAGVWIAFTWDRWVKVNYLVAIVIPCNCRREMNLILLQTHIQIQNISRSRFIEFHAELFNREWTHNGVK